jgi:hypothetical protein
MIRRSSTVQPLLALRAADDLPDPRRQHVHRRHRLPVVVLTHVERLDVLGVVHHHHGLTEVLLRQIPLVLALQVAPPRTGNSKDLPDCSSISTALV